MEGILLAIMRVEVTDSIHVHTESKHPRHVDSLISQEFVAKMGNSSYATGEKHSIPFYNQYDNRGTPSHIGSFCIHSSQTVFLGYA